MLSDQQIRAYEEDGVVVLRNVFSKDWLDEVRRAVNFGRANPGPMYLDYSKDTKPGTYCADMWIWRENEHMKNFIFNSPAARLAGETMRAESVALITDNWMVREAGAVNRAPWHQDNPYFDVSGVASPQVV
ncbi:phytanoyl-CoA dioxygenase family protein [Mesorhizobium sp. Cs1321R2N1]|uniref:phytanoyl-CoA dioxygenase family protein n=1 Tax=Mesorhizobium sp. Cs1321R2N1 TaxID=3015174 RepID=UPI00301B78E6